MKLSKIIIKIKISKLKYKTQSCVGKLDMCKSISLIKNKNDIMRVIFYIQYVTLN